VQKTAIRRHLGVPFAGTAQAGRLYGWRFTWYNEDLEYRMNNLQPAEEQLITGVSLGSFRIDGNPAVGNTITFTLDDGTNHIVVAYTVQTSDFAAPANPVNPSESSPLYSIAQNAVRALRASLASIGYQAVAIMPADLFSPTYTAPYFAEVVITGPGASIFTLLASQSGTTNLLASQQGVPSPVVATIAGALKYGFVSILDALSMGMTQADLSLSYTLRPML